MSLKGQPKGRILLIVAVVAAFSLTGGMGCDKGTSGDSVEDPFHVLEQKLRSLSWVAYAPTNFNPAEGVVPSYESLEADLRVLHQAGFEGLVTYGADIADTMVALVGIAEASGFQGIILGVWDPSNEQELARVREAARYDVVVGFVAGNEGLGVRYDYATLMQAMQDLSETTGKLVTTTEEIEDYQDDQVLELGDWVFPNVHPYWHGITEPSQAVAWTEEQFRNLAARTDKVVVLKEVGLPSAGDPAVSEDKQAEYYRLLQETTVRFVYFEAFDQVWKVHAPVEPHWGLFRSDRSPKKVVSYLP